MTAEINVQKILFDIRNEIKEKGYSDAMLSFKKPLVDDTDNSNDINYAVSYYGVLDGGNIKNFCKKVVRRLIRPIVLPIVVEQNLINEKLVQTVDGLKERIATLEAKVAEAEK